MKIRILTALLVPCALVTLWAGCGSEEKPTGAVAQIAASSGGSVGRPDSARIDIPAGALKEDAEVSVQPRDAASFSTGGVEVVGSVWEFKVGTRDHYEFDKPVTIRIPAADAATLAHWDGTWQPVAGARRESGDLVADVAHFSAYAAVRVVVKDGKAVSTRLDAGAYIAPAVEIFNESNVYLTLVPDKVRYAEAETYADVPFVVCLPFEIPYRDARVRVYADVLLMMWDGVPDDQLLYRTWGIATFGLFRLDGKEIPSVAWQTDSPPAAPVPAYLAREGPMPTWIGAASVKATESSYKGQAFYTQMGRRNRELFQQVSGTYKATFIPRHFVLESAEPGWYVFWVAASPENLHRGWPPGSRGEDKLTAHTSAAIVVSRVPLVNLLEVEFMFDRGKKPDGATAEGSCQLFRYELPVTLRRNGWVLDRLTVSEKEAPGGTVVEHRVEANKVALGLDHDDDLKHRWGVEFPAALADNGVADATVTGGNTGSDTSLWFRYDTTHEGNWCKALVEPTGSSKAESLKDFESSWGGDAELMSYYFHEPAASALTARDVKERYRLWGGSPSKEDRKALFQKKEGDWPPVLSFRCGPWMVDGFYKRRKDLAPLATRAHDASPATTVVEDEDDGFWKWFDQHLELAAKIEADTKARRLQLSTLAAQRKQLCQQWYGLMRVEMETPMPGDIADLSLLPASMTEDPVVFETRRMAALRKAQRDQVRDQVHAIRPQQEKLVTESLAGLQQVVASFEGQWKKSSARNKPLLLRWKDDAARRVDLEKLYTYDAAGWYEPHELPALITEVAKGGLALDLANVLQARSLLAQAEHHDYKVWLQMMSPVPYQPGGIAELASQQARAQAMKLLREVLRANPENADAKALLLDLELQSLRRIAAKLEREKQASLAEFGQYFVKRGFDATDPGGWWSGACEFVSVAWGTGPITLSAGIPEWMGGYDVPSAVAEQTALTQDAAARNQVALLVVRRLRQNGIPLDQMAHLSDEALEKGLEWRTTSNQALTPERIRAMNLDVRGAFVDLPDLRALAAGDLDGFYREQGKSYYGSILSDESWGEYLGHLFSPKNLITILGPSAIVNVGGKLAYVRPTTAARIAELESLGQVERGREVIVGLASAAWPKLPGAGRLGTSLGEKGGGEWVRRALNADKDVLDKVYAAGKAGQAAWVANVVGRMGAAVVVFGGVSHLAHESDIPGLGMLVDAFFEFSGEEILFDVISRSGTPLRTLVGQVDQYGRFLDLRRGQLQELRGQIDRIEQAIRNKAKEIPLADLPPLPEGPPTLGMGIQKAMEDARHFAANGDYDEALRVLRNATEFTQKLGAQIDEQITRYKSVRKYLDTAWEDRVVQQFRDLPKIGRQPQAPPFHLTADQYQTHAGQAVAEGDKALKRGDWEKAAYEYRRAAARGRLDGADSTLLDAIDDRLALAGNAARARKVVNAWRQQVPESDASRLIGDDEVRELIETLASGQPMELVKVAHNRSVYRITDRQDRHWYFKTIDEAANRQAELAGPALARAVGIPAPASRRASLGTVTTRSTDAAGKVHEARIEASGVLMRDVVGTSLLSGGVEPLAVAMKDDYARHRLFRAWLADSDHHLDNMLVGRDGRAWALDFGMGNLTKEKVLAQNPNLHVASQADMVRHALTLTGDDYFQQAAPGLYTWVRRMDEMTHYDDMAATLKAITDLCKDRTGLRKILHDAGLREQALDDAVDVLIERADALERVFRRFPLGLPVARLDRGDAVVAFARFEAREERLLAA